MDTLLSIAQLVALASASALCIYLIVVLVQLRGVLTTLQKSLVEFNERARPVIENLQIITEKLKSIATKIDEQVALVKGSLESIKMAADNVVMFEQRVRQWLEEPIFRITSAFSGVVSGILSWFDRWRGGDRS